MDDFEIFIGMDMSQVTVAVCGLWTKPLWQPRPSREESHPFTANFRPLYWSKRLYNQLYLQFLEGRDDTASCL